MKGGFQIVDRGERMQINLMAPWTAAGPAPTVYGRAGHDDIATGVQVGETCVARLAFDHEVQIGPEGIDRLVRRAALQCGSAEPFELVYPEN